MDSSRVYRAEQPKIYHNSQNKVQPSVNHIYYRDGSKQTHHANLHFVCNGEIVETLEKDVTFAWANSVKKELQHSVPYRQGVLVVVSIYAKDQINGGQRRSSKTIAKR